MPIDEIEALAAKYLEIGGMGRMMDHAHFSRDEAEDSEEARSLWKDHIETLGSEDRRRFELLVEEFRSATQ